MKQTIQTDNTNNKQMKRKFCSLVFRDFCQNGANLHVQFITLETLNVSTFIYALCNSRKEKLLP